MKNTFEQLVKLRLSTQESIGKKKEEEVLAPSKVVNLAEYPWDECIADQVARYGDEETAKRICGWIKANYKSNFQEGDDLESACWPGYKAVGLKELDGRMVPNCVPEEKMKVVKEGFPIPSPVNGEDESEFISRCNSELYNDFPDDAQRNAVCYKSWRGE